MAKNWCGVFLNGKATWVAIFFWKFWQAFPRSVFVMESCLEKQIFITFTCQKMIDVIQLSSGK